MIVAAILVVIVGSALKEAMKSWSFRNIQLNTKGRVPPRPFFCASESVCPEFLVKKTQIAQWRRSLRGKSSLSLHFLKNLRGGLVLFGLTHGGKKKIKERAPLRRPKQTRGRTAGVIRRRGPDRWKATRSRRSFERNYNFADPPISIQSPCHIRFFLIFHLVKKWDAFGVIDLTWYSSQIRDITFAATT